MRTLFLKIFTWFWLAMALVVLAHFVSTSIMIRDERRGPFRSGPLEVYATTAAEKFERDGKQAVADYIGLVEKTSPIRVYLFDRSGREVTDRVAPPEARDLALGSGKRAGRGGPGGPDMSSRTVTTPGGNTYILVGAESHARPMFLPIPFWPHVWWAQLLAVILTTGPLCYWLARYLSSPVVKLRAATQQLAAGDLTARVGSANGRRRDELADMGRDFDIMAERIETLMNSQKRLLHDVSHELRSPLARMRIALELAKEGDGQDSEWAMERIEREAERLNQLIGQLLTLARLESGSPSGKDGPVDLKQLVEDVASDADFEARSLNRGVKVTASDECTVTGDPELLRSAVENVVRNAVRYTPEGSDVEVSLTRVKNGGAPRASILVRDHGAGVPETELQDIFRPFYRVGDSRDRESGGLGLGLSITARAIRLHGGSVTASNSSEGGLMVELQLSAR